MKTLKYKSKDNYFDIIEKIRYNEIIMICLFPYSIDNIEKFKTIRTFNFKNELLKYENSYGDIIYYEKPLKVNYKLKLINGNKNKRIRQKNGKKKK
jgi:hypothetical protein